MDAGNYAAPLPASLLGLTWLLGSEGGAGLLAVRVWSVLRRLHQPGDLMLPPRQLLGELRERLGNRELTRGQVRGALALLRGSGLLSWERGARLDFPAPDSGPMRERLAPLGKRGRVNWRTPVRVSHAQLDYVAGCRAPGRIAALLGALVRCDFDADGVGRAAVAFMAAAAGLSRSAAERGLRELLRAGLLERLAADPRCPSYWRSGGQLRVGERAAPRAGRRRRPEAAAAPPKRRQSDGGGGNHAGEVTGSTDEQLRIQNRIGEEQSSCASARACAGAAPDAVACAADPEPERARPAAAATRWPPALQLSDLADPHKLLRDVLPLAVARGHLANTPHGKRQLLARAAAAQRGKRSPCGWFVRAVERGDESWAADCDMDEARRRWLAAEARREERGRPGAVTRSAPPAGVPGRASGARPEHTGPPADRRTSASGGALAYVPEALRDAVAGLLACGGGSRR